MRIKMLTIMAGPEGVFQPGAERELPTPQARMLIQAGAAVAVEEAQRVQAAAPARETAAIAPPETPEEPQAAKRKG